jgi:phosphoribosyl-ATP pyrophosphohydrolase
VSEYEFLRELEAIIATRLAEQPDGSYTTRLAAEGAAKVAQKVGEEAVEVVVAALAEGPARLTEEAADLLFHLLVLLRQNGLSLADVSAELERRHDAAN